MVNFLIKSCENILQSVLEKVNNTQVGMEPETSPAKGDVTKTREKLNDFGNVLKNAVVIFVLSIGVCEVVVVMRYLLNPETSIKESLQNLTEQIKNHSLEKDIVSYMVNSIPWTTEYMLATEIVFLLYIWAISCTKPKPFFDIANIFIGNLIDGLAFWSLNLLLYALIRLMYLRLLPDFTIPSYIFVILIFHCVGIIMVKNVVFDLKKAQLGIHDPRTYLKKVIDHWRFKTCEADKQLRKTDADDIKGELKFHVFFHSLLLLSGIHVFVQQKLSFSEINEEISKYVGYLVKMDVESHVRIFLVFCDYLIITDFFLLGYLYIIKGLLTETKPFVTRAHIVAGTLISWMTNCCMFLEYILLAIMVVANFAFLQDNSTDPIYLIFVQLCLLFCDCYIFDIVHKLKKVSQKQFVMSEYA